MEQCRNFVKGFTVIPLYDYDRVLKHIQAASYPAGLGSINLVLYQYMQSIEVEPFYSPQSFFLIASILFFFISIFIGLGIVYTQEKPPFGKKEIKDLKYRQSFVIVTAFVLAIIFDLLGIIFLMTLSMSD
jgi:hypothetical protein